MENNTVKDQSELSEVTRPLIKQEDGASSNFRNDNNDTINKSDKGYIVGSEEKELDQITTNMTIDTSGTESGLIENNPKKVILKEDEKLRKSVEDAPLTFVDQDDGILKLLGKACGVRKERLIDEDFEPYTKAATGKRLGSTSSEEAGFEKVKLKEIHLNSDTRVGERLAYQINENVIISENEKVLFEEKHALSYLRSTKANVSCDVIGTVPTDQETQKEKQRLYKKRVESQAGKKIPNPDLSFGLARSQGGLKSHIIRSTVNEDIYNFNHSQRGYMLTIVNDQFARQTARDGAQWDLLKMKEIGRKFGFRSMNHNQERNLTKEQVLRWLSVAQRTDHSDCDCFIFMISTHGLEQRNARKGGQVDHALVCSDDQLIFTSTILDMFNDANCPSLKGKPKIFYIQACRGERLDHGGEVFVAYPKNEDKTCGISNEGTDRRGRESFDESDTNFGEDSWAIQQHGLQSQEAGAVGATGGHTAQLSSYNVTSSHHNSATHLTSTSASSNGQISDHLHQSRPPSQGATTGNPQHASIHPSSSRTRSAQASNKQQPSFMVPRFSHSIYPQYHNYTSKVLLASGRFVNKIHAPTPYAIVDTPSLKCDNDMLIMFAIPPGMFAWRNTSEGSWMIDYLHKILMAYDMRRPKNFLNLMTKVSALMSRRTTNTPSTPKMHAKTAVSVIEHKLDKDIFFTQKVPGSDWVKKATPTFAL